LGPWPDPGQPAPESVQQAYGQLIAAWIANGRRPLAPAPKKPSTPTLDDVQKQAAVLTVRQACIRYLEYAKQAYVDPETGEPGREWYDYALSLRPLVWLRGDTPAGELGPLALKGVREIMVSGYEHGQYGEQRPLSRKIVNQRIGRIKRVWRWLASEELVPGNCYHALMAVAGLRRGRTTAKETKPIQAVDPAVVERTIPHLPDHVQGIIRLMFYTGMRPNEACRIRLGEIDRSGAIWLYTPRRHKTAHHGHARIIALGPKAQAILKAFIRYTCPRCKETTARRSELPWGGELCGTCDRRIRAEPGWFGCGPWPNPENHGADEPIFSPLRQREERFRAMRKRRRTKVQPSQRNRKKAKPMRLPGRWYTPNVLGRAVALACRKNKIPHWHPNQLRHLAATLIRARHGIEAASTVLGHSRLNTTEIYAEKNMSLAERIAAEMG
jgi:integrase